MTEEEYFIKYFPDFCYGDKPLSPHWDLFQYGVEFGERESEEKIKELEQENTELKTKKIPQLERRIASIRGSHSVDTKKLNARTEQVERLKKENAELKSKKGCESCTKFDEVQLTNAKEIIREFVEWATWQGSNCPNFKSIQDKAEQFLKENEE